MENVWEYLRANQLSKSLRDSYAAIVDACCTAWNGLMTDAKRSTSITTRTWT